MGDVAVGRRKNHADTCFLDSAFCSALASAVPRAAAPRVHPGAPTRTCLSKVRIRRYVRHQLMKPRPPAPGSRRAAPELCAERGAVHGAAACTSAYRHSPIALYQWVSGREPISQGTFQTFSPVPTTGAASWFPGGAALEVQVPGVKRLDCCSYPDLGTWLPPDCVSSAASLTLFASEEKREITVCPVLRGG